MGFPEKQHNHCHFCRFLMTEIHFELEVGEHFKYLKNII